MQRPALKFVQCIAGIVVGFSFSLSSAQAQTTPVITPEAVAKRLSGLLIYQLEGDRQIHMTTCPVTPKGWTTSDMSNLYLYQEQARDDKLDQPYRQRFLNLKAIGSNQVESVSYRPVNAENWVGLCQKEERDRLVTEQDLLPSHCTVTLETKGKNFVGKTPEQGCPSNYRGAAFVRNQVILTNTGMKTYDQGFDANGNLVWGSDGTPYTFKKVIPQ